MELVSNTSMLPFLLRTLFSTRHFSWLRENTDFHALKVLAVIQRLLVSPALMA
jgi:hypothetical protein